MLELKSKLQNRISSDSSLEQQALEPLLDFWWLSKEESSTFETWYFKTDNHSSPSLFKVNWSFIMRRDTAQISTVSTFSSFCLANSGVMYS